MAYNVDRLPSPPEKPPGHWEYDQDDGETRRFWVRDFDDDGNPVEEE
jgi:hypothetical protein